MAKLPNTIEPMTELEIKKLFNRTLEASASRNVSTFAENKDKYSANEAAYLQGLYDIATKGRVKYSRPGQATLSLSGTQQRFDLTGNKIPLLGSKEIFHRSFLIENQWFLSGDDNIKFLKDRNVSIWDSWVIPETAVFEPAEKQTGSDVENYIRCHYPEVFKLLVEYKRDKGIGIPSAPQMMEFISYANQSREMSAEVTKGVNNIPCVRLVAGLIGAGAYGPAWRKWADTRVVPADEDRKYTERGFDYHDSLIVEDEDVFTRNIDQFADAVKMLRTGADSRRIIVSAWNAAKIDEAALPPCHSFIQFVSYDNFDGGPRDLVCNLYMR